MTCDITHKILCGLCSGGYGSAGRLSVDGSSSAAPDYIGCLSQMSNSFLTSSAEDSSAGATVSVSRQNSGGDHVTSLPPTPVGSQLSGSQICTPLDGQV